MFQELSEKFIRKFCDKVKWHHISSNQKLSLKFIEEFFDKIDWQTFPSWAYEKYSYRHWDKIKL
jgi:hypothetical protein